MNRRTLLKSAVATGVSLTLAGCQGGGGCDPDIEKTDDTSVYTEPSGPPVYITEGTVTNVSECAIGSVRLEGFLLDKNDEVIRQNETYVRDLSPKDDELFVMKFHPSMEEAQNVDTYNVNANIQDK